VRFLNAARLTQKLKFLLAAATLLACGSGASSPAEPSAGSNAGGQSSAAGTNASSGTGGAAGSTSAAGLAGNAGLAGAPRGGAPSTGGSAGSAGTVSGDAGSAGGGGGPVPVAHILGADVSWLLEDEAAGATYYDGDQKLDLLALLKGRGFNYIRIRIFVDPSATGGYAAGKPESWCDLAHTIELAQRVRALGMGFLLDFHYSDNWADPGKQVKPAQWAALPFAELVTAVHDYSKATVAALKAAGVTPDMVQVGNEITPGMLFPDGSSENANWPKLGQLLKAGATAVQEVDPNIRIMLHIEKGGDNATTRWWVDHAIAEQVPFQILGQSCYTEFQGTPESWQANFADLVTRYPTLDFVIAEYSQEKRKANDIMRALPDQRGLGTFIWEPTRWMEAIFDRQGQRYDGNAWLDTYSQIADDYGLPQAGR
jgi:arabinogalactan endo-1,4-beta-galactosidase